MINLKEVVSGYLKETDEGGDAYARAFSFAIDGYRDLMYDIGGKLKSSKLQIRANKTAVLPEDLLNWTKIGVLNDRLEIATLTENKQISLSDACSPDRLEQAPQQTFYPFFNNFYFYNNWFSPNVSSPSLGIGSAVDIGDFTIDWTNRLILFGKHVAYDHCYIEYLCFPSTEAGEYLIHPFMVEALKNYIYWASIRKNKRIPRGEKRAAELDYYKQRKVAVMRMNPVTIQGINDQRKHIKMAPKS